MVNETACKDYTSAEDGLHWPFEGSEKPAKFKSITQFYSNTHLQKRRANLNSGLANGAVIKKVEIESNGNAQRDRRIDDETPSKTCQEKKLRRIKENHAKRAKKRRLDATLGLVSGNSINVAWNQEQDSEFFEESEAAIRTLSELMESDSSRPGSFKSLSGLMEVRGKPFLKVNRSGHHEAFSSFWNMVAPLKNCTYLSASQFEGKKRKLSRILGKVQTKEGKKKGKKDSDSLLSIMKHEEINIQNEDEHWQMNNENPPFKETEGYELLAITKEIELDNGCNIPMDGVKDDLQAFIEVQPVYMNEDCSEGIIITDPIVNEGISIKDAARAISGILHLKPLQKKWREVDVAEGDPSTLVHKRCKIYCPLDGEWHPGFICGYSDVTRKHQVIYDVRDERKWLSLHKERLALYIYLHEKVNLILGSGYDLSLEEKHNSEIEEMLALATIVEDFDGTYQRGDIIWAEIKGYPMWPAFVMDERRARFRFGQEHVHLCNSVLASGKSLFEHACTLPVQFFGSHDYARVNPNRAVSFSRGLLNQFHVKCRRMAFEHGLKEVQRFLKENKLPDSMQEEICHEHEYTCGHKELGSDTDDDFMGDERRHKVKRSVRSLFTCPIRLGSLCVLNLGKIVKDSEYFHDQHYIWTEGYTAIRRYLSMKDPSRLVYYKMEVLKNPLMRAVPLFRITSDDGEQVEGATASACWRKVFDKVKRAKEKSEPTNNQLEKKRQVYKSGAAMFGFSNPHVSRLIQALPNARVCCKFQGWADEMPSADMEGLMPAGFRAVEVEWKHLDCCSVCYTNEEYEGNVLLQCDKCRMLVHMDCYGEDGAADGNSWLCNLCRPEAPKQNPPCCLCPVKGGAMKKTADGRWVHLACVLWIPEIWCADMKRMEPIDGLNSINKERWKLLCSLCKVPYGACIQCAEHNCRVSYHPLCARAAGLCTKVIEGFKRKRNRSTGCYEEEKSVRLNSYCLRHKQQRRNNFKSQAIQACSLRRNASGCARCEPYNWTARRGRREPQAQSAAVTKRSFVESQPYIIGGFRKNNMDDHPSKAIIIPHSEGCTAAYVANEHLRGSIQENADPVVLSMSQRFIHMQSTVHHRLTFGKSEIHGWGLFTKRKHSAGDMVIEYAGEVVRSVVADIRERRCYNSLVGAGTYMFCIDDERVIDATHAGSIAHLINHSCEPNCYSRVIPAGGRDRIIIFAKRNILEGEELTYDYRFTSIGEQLSCHCGCLGCRGTVNVMDDTDESGRIFVPCAELRPWGPA